MTDDPKISQTLFGPRVRMAPSPTGWLHIGTARTTLFNFLFANHYGGKFVLRIEDTDKERSKKEYEEDIIKNLKWLGINWDEGPDIGGPFGPYRQSERLDIYRKYLKELLDKGLAFYCFCSPEKIALKREEMLSRGEAPRYDGTCNRLSPAEVKANLKNKKPWVIRFRMPNKKIKIKDLIRGEMEFDASLIGDIIIAKSFEEPLYNFAVVIDDYLMKISHVIRGEDHISNTPKQIAIAEALGFELPQYAHLPMILGPDRSKLSKRHGAMAINDYRRQGYLPEALVNFIALLGWHPTGNQEIFSLNELIQQFSLERVQKSGAVFNISKLNWMNSYYLNRKPLEERTELLIKYFLRYKLANRLDDNHYEIKGSGLKVTSDWFKRLLEIESSRINKFGDLLINDDFLFKESLDYDRSLFIWKQMSESEVLFSIDKSIDLLSSLKKEDWQSALLENRFRETLLKEPTFTSDRGRLLWPLRVALTAKKGSAGPYEVLELLGPELSLKRLKEVSLMLKSSKSP